MVTIICRDCGARFSGRDEHGAEVKANGHACIVAFKKMSNEDLIAFIAEQGAK